MYRETRKGTKGILVSLGKAMMKRKTLASGMDAVSSYLAAVPWLDGKSRADIRSVCDVVCRRCLLVDREKIPYLMGRFAEDVMQSFNRAYKRRWVRTRETDLKSSLKLHRDMDEPIVFYLVSWHVKPQKAHAKFQGEILLDNAWRAVLSGDTLSEVRKWVRTHRPWTVQAACGKPDYLLLRPNCRHRLIPLRTHDVLTKDLWTIRNEHRPLRFGVRKPITDAERWAEFRDLRNEIVTVLLGYVKKGLG